MTVFYRVLVDGERPDSLHQPHKPKDMKSERHDYTHAVVCRELNKMNQGETRYLRVFGYRSSLEGAEKTATTALRRAQRQGYDNIEFLVVPLASRIEGQRSPNGMLRWSECYPGGGTRGYETPEVTE